MMFLVDVTLDIDWFFCFFFESFKGMGALS